MRIDSIAASPTRSETARGFEAMADAIMYRWSVERDTWVSAAEVEEARAYLERAGVTTTPMADGKFAVAGETRNPRDLVLNHYQTFGREPFGYAIGPIKERGDETGIVVRHGYIVAQWGDVNAVDLFKDRLTA